MIALRRPRSLQVSLLRVRLQRVARGASISITCASDIANTPLIELPLVVPAIHLTHRRRSESQKIRLVLHCTLQVLIGRHRLATTRVEYVGGTLFGCCCWSGAAVVLISWILPTCTEGEDVYFALQKAEMPTRVILDALPNLVYKTAIFMAGFSLSGCSCVIHLPLFTPFTSQTSQSEHQSLWDTAEGTRQCVIKYSSQSHGNKRSRHESAPQVSLRTPCIHHYQSPKLIVKSTHKPQHFINRRRLINATSSRSSTAVT